MTDARYPQVRIVPERFLNPDTTERLLNLIVAVKGVRRVLLNGPRLPATVPYGPARGAMNPHTMRRTIRVGGEDVDLQVHVGYVLLELESSDVIPGIRAACDEAFTEFGYSVKEGRFMKTEATLADYAKYGPDADKSMIGMADPRSRSGPVIIQGCK
ncbi:MAG TPA: methyl-coenzyme M reductase operon protein D [Methanoregulaceae archaeon]|jgi:methyl-coenzyme M reductase subunit D|nr:methyl-coenzyme M reductase operon protein D [Methanoregulaceae archaeon]